MIGLILDDFGCRFAGAVTSARFDADKNRRRAGLCDLQGGRKFEAVPGEDAIIVVGRRDQRGRVFCVQLHIVQWRVFVERFEFLRVFARSVIRGPSPTDGEFLKAEHVEHADNGQRCTP